jgi:hypothetical protein
MASAVGVSGAGEGEDVEGREGRRCQRGREGNSYDLFGILISVPKSHPGIRKFLNFPAKKGTPKLMLSECPQNVFAVRANNLRKNSQTWSLEQSRKKIGANFR